MFTWLSICSGIKCSCIVSEHIIGSVCDNYRINVRPGMINYTSHGVAITYGQRKVVELDTSDLTMY